MSDKASFLQAVREQLIARRSELLALLASGADDAPNEKQGKDLGDEALSATMSKVQSSLEKTEIDEIHLIEAALNRIEVGEYGMCLDCDKEISRRRLEYSPYAARCIPCQEELELNGPDEDDSF